MIQFTFEAKLLRRDAIKENFPAKIMSKRVHTLKFQVVQRMKRKNLYLTNIYPLKFIHFQSGKHLRFSLCLCFRL